MFWYRIKKLFKSNRISRKQVEYEGHILYVAFRSLIGNTPKNLRLASIEWDQRSACMYFYIDGTIDDHIKNTLYTVLDRFRSSCTEKNLKSCDLKIIQTEESQLIVYTGWNFFARKERYYTAEELERQNDILSTFHHVLLGEIPQNLRAASVSWNSHSACHFFYFDGPISEQEREDLEIVGTEFVSHFHFEEMDCFGTVFIRQDEPEEVHCQGRCVYLRKERWSYCD